MTWSPFRHLPRGLLAIVAPCVVGALVYEAQVLASPRGSADALGRGPTAQAIADLLPRSTGRGWRYIVLHHSASASGTVEGMEAVHRGRFPLGLAYHFVVGNGQGIPDGRVVPTRRWALQLQGAHIASRLRDPLGGGNLAAVSIGVCLVGDFERTNPTTAQRAATQNLVGLLRRRYRVPAANILGHNEAHPGHTLCPGHKIAPFLEGLRTEALTGNRAQR